MRHLSLFIVFFYIFSNSNKKCWKAASLLRVYFFMFLIALTPTIFIRPWRASLILCLKLRFHVFVYCSLHLGHVSYYGLTSGTNSFVLKTYTSHDVLCKLLRYQKFWYYKIRLETLMTCITSKQKTWCVQFVSVPTLHSDSATHAMLLFVISTAILCFCMFLWVKN